jgi:hypothetical protein
VQKVENGYKLLGFGDTLSTFVTGFGGHFVHFCNGISPIVMYKYVKGFFGKRGYDIERWCM